MILYVCDTCKASIEAADIRKEVALLVGDRAFCGRCNPRTAAVSRSDSRRPGHGEQDPRHLDPRHLDPRLMPSRRRIDGLYLAGLIGVFILLPAVTSLVTYRFARSSSNGGNGQDAVANKAGDESKGPTRESAATDSLRGEMDELRQENSRLLERLDSLAGSMEASRRASLDAAQDSGRRARDGESSEFARRLDSLDRTIQRLEDSLTRRLDGGGSPASTGQLPVRTQELPAREDPVATVVPDAVDEGAPTPVRSESSIASIFGVLLDSIARGRLPTGFDLAAALEDKDPSVRALACKFAGIAGGSADGKGLDRTVLQNLMRRMRDPDIAVQRAAMVAASEITGERYIAWDDVTAEQYTRIARLRQLWDEVDEEVFDHDRIRDRASAEDDPR